MVAMLASVSEDEARRALESSAFRIPLALIMVSRHCTLEEASALYDAHGGQLHAILNGEALRCCE
jgi:N-acetylmuramic acid 6-phosphate (MurNAc-6-P) etherase